MMEGRRKEVLLLVLAVLALGVALYTFRGKPAPTSPAPVAEKPEGTAPAKEPAASLAGGREGEQAGTPGTAPTAGAAGAQRNPFVAPGAEIAAAQMTPKAGTPKATASAAVGSAGAIPTAGGEPGPAPAGQPGGQPAPGTPAKAAFTLTGIVNGKPNVAILRQDDRRYFVKVGDAVGDGYRVKAIGSQQVVLVGQQGKVTLRMGGRQ
jgi:hypothetical protein